MRLLLISGSVRAGSSNEAVLRTAGELCDEDVNVEHYDGLSTLPHFNPDDDHDPLPHEVRRLRGAIEDADALLFCTPEYAGDLPGSFKNLLDWTVGGIETNEKPAAWINSSAAPAGAAGAHAALRTVLTYTGCEIVDAACLHVPVTRYAVDEGIVTDPELRSQIATGVRALTDYARGRAAGAP